MGQASGRFDRGFALLAAANALLVVYGSLVPFDFVMVPWCVAVERLNGIIEAPWGSPPIGATGRSIISSPFRSLSGAWGHTWRLGPEG